MNKQDLERAVATIEDRLSADPSNALLLNDLGVLRLNLAETKGAILALESAAALVPDNAQIQYNLAIALRSAGRVHDALTPARKALDGAPEDVLRAQLVGAIYNDLERFQDSLDACSFVDPLESASSLRIRVDSLHGLNRHEQSLALLRQGLDVHAGSAALWLIYGTQSQNFGRLTEAEHAFDRAIELSPFTGAHHRAKAEVHRYVEGDPHLQRMLSLLTGEHLHPTDECELRFALGKAFDDLAQFDAAFEQFEMGNRIKRSQTPYDAEGVSALIRHVMSQFPRAMAHEISDPERSMPAPVFVVGMPRSGTTLVEQILARHPDVVGLGERTDFHRSLDRVIFNSPDWPTRSFGTADYRRLARDYIRAISPTARSARRFVDKMPSNFFFLGFIATAFPQARIIHVKRHPLDTCLSCYTKLFTKTQTFSYDLAELGSYYRGYQRITDHWREELPPEQMLEVSYEDLVADTEKVTRRMIEFLDLPWSDLCLRPQDSKSVVSTASSVQVRQPVYSSSVGRHRNYLKHLGPLIEALEFKPVS